MASVFNETIFLKENSSLDEELEKQKNNANVYSNLLKGSYGEKQLMYQLQKANEGMFVLRDVNLECDDMTAQIDFIVITSHHCYFVECKNYTGNIEVNKNGEFVVNTRPGKKNGRKGIKSPVNQVEDQLEIFKRICLKNEEKTRELLNGIRFKDYFKTLVVFTNSENIIKASYAPNNIRSRIIKVDEIIRYIKRGSELQKEKRLNKQQMSEMGNFFLDNNVEKKYTYDLIDNNVVSESKNNTKSEIDIFVDWCKGIAKALIALFFLYILLKIFVWILEFFV